MVGEIADFVAKHKAKLFTGPKKTETKRPGSVGDLGKSLEDNDPETLKFIKKHETQIHGEKPEVKTKYSLDTPQNKRMRPKEGVYEDAVDEEHWIQKAVNKPGFRKGALTRKARKAGESPMKFAHEHEHDKGRTGKQARFAVNAQKEEVEEMEIEESKGKCPKCGASNCTCQHEECGGKIKSKKLKEETLANLIALDVLEVMKESRLEEQEYSSRREAKAAADKAYDASRPTKRSFLDKIMGRKEPPDAQVKSYHRNRGMEAKKKFYDLNSEGVGEIHKVSPADPDYTGGMHIGAKPKAEVQTDHKPVVSSSEKSKKLKKSEVKEGHKDPTPHLDNPEHGSGCTGHEDPMIHVKKPQSDPTKIPNMNKPGNSTQPKAGVLDRKKKKISEEDVNEGLLNWIDKKVAQHQGQWARAPSTAKKKQPKVPAGYVKAKQEVSGGLSARGNAGKWVQEEEELDEVSAKRLGRYIETASRDVRNKEHTSGFRAGLGGLEPDQNRERKIKNRQRGIDTAAGKLSDRWVKVKANEDVLHETLPADASASDYIHDFVHSDNKMFKGDSKKKRIKRALGAYYHKHKK